MVLTGAGGGIMRACQEGSGRERSFGVNIRLPWEQGAALDEEADEPELAALPRLILFFNRVNSGRLRQLIDVINRDG